MYDIVSNTLLKSKPGLNFSWDLFSISYGSSSIEPTIRILRDIFKNENHRSLRHFFVNSQIKDDQRSRNVGAYLLQSGLKHDQNIELYTTQSFGEQNNNKLFDDQEDLNLLPKNHSTESQTQPIDFFIAVEEDLSDKDYKKIVKNLSKNGSLFIHIDKKGTIVFLVFDVVSNPQNTRSCTACRYLRITNPTTNIAYEISFWEDEIKYSRIVEKQKEKHLPVAENFVDYLKHGGPRGSIRKDTLFYDLQESNNINEFVEKFFRKTQKDELSIKSKNNSKGKNKKPQPNDNYVITSKDHKKTETTNRKGKLPVIINIAGVLCIFGIIGIVSWPFIKNLVNGHKNKLNQGLPARSR